MSRRKPLAKRDPCGRLAKVTADKHLLAPTQIRRMIDSAAAAAKDPLLASMLGRLALHQKITGAQLAAGKRWGEIVAAYHIACRSPSRPRTVILDAIGGSGTDPDTEQGAKEVARHERASADFINGRSALRQVGSLAERVVDAVVCEDLMPVGWSELEALRKGLDALLELWSERRKASVRR